MTSEPVLNEQISLLLESKPDYKPEATGSISGLVTFLDRPADTIAWRFSLREQRWQPIEWTTSEAACARLLDVMKRSLIYCPWPGDEGWRVHLGVTRQQKLIAPLHADRKTAICLAFIAYFSGLSDEAKDQVRKEIAK